MNNLLMRLLPAVMIASLLYACGPSQKTTVESQTTSPATNSFKKLMVFAHIEDSFNRRMIEVGIAQALEQKGIKAVSTYRSINGGKDSSARAMARNAAAMGADGLLVLTNTKAGNNTDQNTPFGLILFGSPIPLTGGITQGETLQIDATLHSKGSAQPVWRMEFSQKVGDNVKLLGDAINTAVVDGLVNSGALRLQKTQQR